MTKKSNTEKKPEDVWIEFLSWVSLHKGNWVYRGVSNKREHLLVPSIGRKEIYRLETEINLFEEFKLKANLHTNAKNDFEWLAIAQHHGLPTRLLDWTFNPLVAVFFATTTERESDKTRRIYAFNPTVGDYIDTKKESDPFKVDRIKVLYPPVSTNRIELQRGLFSIHPVPNKPAMILQDSDRHDTVLTEMEYAYTMHKDNRFHQNNIPFFDNEQSNNREYLIKHQENYLNNHCDNQLTFDIPSTCREIFEQNIRNLGVDELIFGGIDSIANHIRHKFQKDLISYHILPQSFYFNPEWENVLSLNFYKNSDYDSLRLNGAECNYLIEKNARFTIKESDFELKEIMRSNAEISGITEVTLRPNYFRQKSLFFSPYANTEQFLNKLRDFFVEIFYEFNVFNTIKDIEGIKFKASVNWVSSRFRKALNKKDSMELKEIVFSIDGTAERELEETNNKYAKVIDQFNKYYQKIPKEYHKTIYNKDTDPEAYNKLISNIQEKRKKRKEEREKQSADK